jgi:hypothetical protein
MGAPQSADETFPAQSPGRPIFMQSAKNVVAASRRGQRQRRNAVHFVSVVA